MLEEEIIKPQQVIKRLLCHYIAPLKKRILIAIFFMIIVAICSAAIVRLTKPVIDYVLIAHDRNMLVVITCVIILIYIIKGIAEYCQSYIIKSVGQQILTNLQMEMYERLLYADLLFIQSQSSGRLISRCTHDIMLMRSAVSSLLVGCAKHFFSIVFLIGIMFSIDAMLSAIVFLAFPIAIYPIQKLSRRMRAITAVSQDELSNFTARLDESFYSIKIIKSFCTEKFEVNRARKITHNIMKLYQKAAQFDSLSSPIMEFLSGITIVSLIWYGSFAIMHDKMTTGALFTFITAFVSAYRPFKSLVALNVSLQEGIASANRVFNILDIQPKIKDALGAPDVVFQNPQIVFCDVTMQFTHHNYSLKQFNLKIHAGKTYAFIGTSGSGKTTIANLLTRMFDPSAGTITIDNYDIKDITLQSLRQQIAFVTQEVMLFDASVFDNITYGCGSNITMEQAISAAQYADAHEFIMALPNGYDTLIGSGGKSLSGGQRQRISIARAFLKDAPILILDEATSALDPYSDRKIVNALHTIRSKRTNHHQNKTILIISHRINSTKVADQIVVMHEGQIIEQGSHIELMNNKQEYYKLYNKELQQGKKYV